MTVGSLFAGIGGFDLAARWMGWKTKWVSEIDPHASAVLAKHFPVPNHGDITRIKGTDVEHVDLLCGGFPCQDISLAGKGAGIEGSRSGLWSHYARLIEEIQPHYIVAENVSALRSRGLDRVLKDLMALGYDAEWHCVPASSVGAPHRRDRCWIVGYSRHRICGGESWGGARKITADGHLPLQERRNGTSGNSATLADSTSERCGEARQLRHGESAEWTAAGSPQIPARDVRNTTGERLPFRTGESLGQSATVAELERSSSEVADALSSGSQGHAWYGPIFGGQGQDGSVGPSSRLDGGYPEGWWDVEPDVGRVAHGIPSRVDRIRCLGNAIVPQVAYKIFQGIARYELERAS